MRVTHELKIQKLPKSKSIPKEVVISGSILNGYQDTIIPIEEFNERYIAAQRRRECLYHTALFVRFNDTPEGVRGCAAFTRQRWLEDEGVWVITNLYNAHGLYDYANLRD